MIHKSHFPAQPGSNAAKFDAMAKNLAIEDGRIEAIIRENATIPNDKWTLHALHDVTFTAQEAINFGIAQDQREFQIPAGNQVFNI